MAFDVSVIGTVVGFMVLANRLVEALFTPIFEKYNLDRFWLMYIAWAMSGLLVGFADVNLFAAYIPNEILAKILTAIVAGGGANLLHDLTNQQSSMLVVELGGEEELAKG